MSQTMAHLRRKIDGAGDLQSVVRTMKALAASTVAQCEASLRALADYHRTVELGLGACLREGEPASGSEDGRQGAGSSKVGAIVFGSDQGLVGRFNDVVADHAIQTFSGWAAAPQIWAVGERLHARLQDSGLSPVGRFAVPNSVEAIAPLIGRIQLESEEHRAQGGYTAVHVIHNQPRSGALYEPVHQQWLPLDADWQQRLTRVPWPTRVLPDVMGDVTATLRTLIREHLFISLFKACAESLASENASRLEAMERADKNIDELLGELHGAFHRLRQGSIDEELFDVIAGFEASATAPKPYRPG